jgi:peptide/nickel transport system ATP-binding protein/oligopeptide transport system ATP-binding protein
MSNVILDVKNLRTYFFTMRGIGKAVDGVSFELRRGETLGLVGESGCGKSMTCLSTMRLNPTPASRIVGGEVLLHGEDLLRKPDREMRTYRGRHVAIVLQDSMTALNPVFTIGHQLYEPLRIHQRLRGSRLRQRAIELLHLLRIPAAETRLRSFPHQFSGGMRQRAVGAIAFSCDPEVLIAEKPTTSLDVTAQAAFLELLKDIQRRSNLALLFVTHDFGVVAQMCDRVAVMYAGKIIETADTRRLFDSCADPYTEALLQSVPDVNVQMKRLQSIAGQPPSIYNLPVGCPFAPRCPYVHDRCWQEFPPEKEVTEGHSVSCWRYV